MEHRQALKAKPTARPLKKPPAIPAARAHPRTFCSRTQFQRAIGNQATGGLIQAKSSLSRPGHFQGQEADRAANQVMRLPDAGPRVQGQYARDPTGEREQDRQNQPGVNRASASEDTASAAPSVVQNVLSSPGRPLDPDVRAFMETRFGYDFSRVRVHTDMQAAKSARAVNALAYTVGRDVVFDSGQYAPEGADGQRLLAHELTHVIQQARWMTPPGSLQRSNGSSEEEVDEEEVEARQAEETVSEPAGREISPTAVRRLRLLPLPELPDLRVTGIGLSRPTMYLEGPSGQLFDLSPYTGNRALDLPLAAMEALGIPILSYFHFHYGRAAALRGLHFRNVYGLSGGTSFIRNAVFYGYIEAENVDLYGAPSSYSDHYDLLPNLGIHANPLDIGTMIHVDYFNSPLPDQPNNPTIIFSLVAPFDHNPLEAISNLGGAVYHLLGGRLYSIPGVTHDYPEFWRTPEEGIGQ